MNVNLGPTFDRFVAGLVKSGLYQTNSEVIREALRLLKEREDQKRRPGRQGSDPTSAVSTRGRATGRGRAARERAES
jgi:putative addiction module CopG family antidote